MTYEETEQILLAPASINELIQLEECFQADDAGIANAMGMQVAKIANELLHAHVKNENNLERYRAFDAIVHNAMKIGFLAGLRLEK